MAVDMRILVPFLLTAVLVSAQALDPRTGRSEGKLKPGDAAPGFSLKHSGKETRVSLEQFRGKRPVALVFGSYT
jgi:hypothetical protein